MDLGLKDQVAVVMASSRGLGRACAVGLAREGCHLAICSRHLHAIEETAKVIRDTTGARVLAAAVDVMNPGQVEEFAKRTEAEYGHVDILVNNGGGPKPGRFDGLSEEDFRQATELLFHNVVRTTKLFLPLIRKREMGGRIITITSTSVHHTIDNLLLSNSLRAAVRGWAKTLSRELGPEGILVNCVAPGTIETERIRELMFASAHQSGTSTEAELEKRKKAIPLGRLGSPEEFAAAVVFLASRQASYISGTTLIVDGAASQTVT